MTLPQSLVLPPNPYRVWTDNEPEYEYNDEAAHRALTFVRGLAHTKGEYAGRPFGVRPWQEVPLRRIFGYLNEDGSRQYRSVYWEIPRKNGKSEVAAAIALKMLFADSEPGAEIYGAAEDREQAGIVFSVAAQMVRQNEKLEERCRIVDSQRRIIIKKTNSFYRVIPADAAGAHGFNAHAVIVDELHTQPNRELWDVLTTSGGTRRQPLTFAISTAGFDRESICWEQHEYAERVANGIVDDPTFFAMMYLLPDEADWTNQALWPLINPALGDFRNAEEMKALFNKALAVPALQNTFRRLYLNQWTSQDVRWLDMGVWDRCRALLNESDLKGKKCYAGLDLASSSDIAALALVFPWGDHYRVIWRFWVPENGLRARSLKDRVNYETWVREGFLRVTPGDVIDYEFIEEELYKLRNVFKIREMAFDPWNALELSQKVGSRGIECRPVRQGFASMSPPTKELMALCKAKRIEQDGNPVARWMANNMRVAEDAAGNIKPDRKASRHKIDGMVAAIMGIDGAMRDPKRSSVYEERGMKSV